VSVQQFTEAEGVSMQIALRLAWDLSLNFYKDDRCILCGAKRNRPHAYFKSSEAWLPEPLELMCKVGLFERLAKEHLKDVSSNQQDVEVRQISAGNALAGVSRDSDSTLLRPAECLSWKEPAQGAGTESREGSAERVARS
jgi:hypothetical protein